LTFMQKILSIETIMQKNTVLVGISLFVLMVFVLFSSCENPFMKEIVEDLQRDELQGRATISGSYWVGHTLTVNTSEIFGGDEENEFKFQWKADGRNVGTNSPTYTIQGSDAGKVIRCVVKRPGTRSNVSARGQRVPAQNQPTGIAVLEGSVYIAGYYLHENRNIACYWKDGVRIDLPVPTETTVSRATSITVSGGSVYIAGYFDNTLCYWKDGVRTDLPAEWSDNPKIAVSAGSVYYIADAGVPSYWKDGIGVELPTPNGMGTPVAITESGGSIYIAGFINIDGVTIPCYWKDGARTDLPVPAGIEWNITGIAVSNGSVFTTAYYTLHYNGVRTACYWKDGVRIDLLGEWGSSTNAVTVSGGDVYILGWYDGILCYWRNGRRTNLSGGAWGSANGIAVSDGSVHITGHFWENDNIIAWHLKDGRRTDLPSWSD
jgi:hypothetical protein